MSHKITGKEPSQQPCGCNTQDIRPSRLDQVIAQYKAMTKEAEAAKEQFVLAALDFDLHLESCTEEEINEMFVRNNH